MIIAGTGHRPDKLGGYTEDAYARLVSIATDYLKENQPSIVISGMALGWDQALAQAAIELHIPVIAAIPFLGQESRWPKESQSKYKALIEKCREVVIVSPGGFASFKMQKRNEYMVNRADVILAMWNGKAEGGTFNCISYAQKKGKKIVNLYDQLKDYE